MPAQPPDEFTLPDEFNHHFLNLSQSGQSKRFVLEIRGLSEDPREWIRIPLVPAPHDHDSEYAAAEHDHDGVYAAVEHNHSGEYSAIGHNHDGDYAPAGHEHDGYATEGQLRFGEDGRISAEIDRTADPDDYVLVAKRQPGESYVTPKWTVEPGPDEADEIDSSIALDRFYQYAASASGKPSAGAGIYVRSAPRELLAIDSLGNAWRGAMTGVGGMSLSTPISRRLERAEGLVEYNGKLYRLDLTTRQATASHESGANYTEIEFGRLCASLAEPHIVAPEFFLTTTRSRAYPSNRIGQTHDVSSTGLYCTSVIGWRGGIVASSYRPYNTIAHNDDIDDYEGAIGIGSAISVVTELAERGAPQGSHVDKIVSTGAGYSYGGSTPLASVGDAIIFCCTVEINGTERLCSIEQSGKIWVTLPSTTPENLVVSRLRGEQRGQLVWPSAWIQTLRAQSGEEIECVSGVLGVAGAGSDLIIFRRTGAVDGDGIYHVALGTAGQVASVAMQGLGALSPAQGQRSQSIAMIGGTPWVLLTDGTLVRVDLSGSAVTWAPEAPEADSSDHAWNDHRDGAWRVVPVTDDPGASRPSILHTDADGNQTSLDYASGSPRVSSRGGEGTHSGAPARLVPLKGLISGGLPDPPASGTQELRLLQDADGNIAWAVV